LGTGYLPYEPLFELKELVPNIWIADGGEVRMRLGFSSSSLSNPDDDHPTAERRTLVALANRAGGAARLRRSQAIECVLRRFPNA
jgi:hypothetical protein